MSTIALIFIVLIAAGALTAFMLFLRSRKEQLREQWYASRRSVVLKVLVPKNNDKSPAAAENLFAALHGIYRSDQDFQDLVSFEIATREKQIEFYIHCPVELRDFVEGQLYAQYPTVEMHEVSDYARADLTGLAVAGTELVLNKPDIFPIKTFQNFQVDPLAGITGVLSKVSDKEQIWIQTIVQPVSDSWQSKATSYVAAARSGNLQRGNLLTLVLKGLVDLFRPTSADAAKPAGPPKLPAAQEQALKAAEEKANKLGFTTKIRIAVIATDQAAAVAKVNSLTGVFKQFNTINLNGFIAGKITTDTKLVEDYRTRLFLDKGNIMNIEELASIYHLPNASVETPNIAWAGSKKGEPPTNLPAEGVVSPDELTLFAMTDFRGHRQKFGMKLKDRRQHMYAIGKSGTGKSTMLENMAIDDIRKGRGVCIVDPHGDFINHVLDAIPASRINDVIYFNPADRDYAIGFNLLENVDPQLKNIVASGVVGIFKKLFAESWGPRLEYILRNVVLALLEYPGATMLDIMRILVNKKYRDHVLDKVKDPVIRDFFLNEYEKYDPKFRTEAIAPVQNKVGQFLSASTIRNIVGQPISTFDIEEAMNTRKILLLDLSIGKIGEDAAALLGSMMITKIQLAAMRRTNITEDERVDFYLYVDEFQNFATESFATILSEARKYKLNLILTHQYIAQMPEPVAKAVFGNTGTIISFRVGANDATALAKEFEPVFDSNDMINLDNHHIYAKMSIDGVTRPAFSAITLAPYGDKNNNREKIIRVSREHYTRPREFVEKKIAETTHMLDDAGPSPFSASTDDTSGETSDHRSKPRSGGTAQVVEREGKNYDATQDKLGKHWYFERFDAEGLPVEPDGEAVDVARTESPKRASEPVADKPVAEVTPMPKPQIEPGVPKAVVSAELKPKTSEPNLALPPKRPSVPPPPKKIAAEPRPQLKPAPTPELKSDKEADPEPKPSEQPAKKVGEREPITEVSSSRKKSDDLEPIRPLDPDQTIVLRD